MHQDHEPGPSISLQGKRFSLADLRGEGQLQQCIQLQRATWGDDFRELVPPAMLMIAQKVGGVLLGAFDEHQQLAGFVFGLTGVVNGEPVHWSHMLAVDTRWRNRGIGRALKQAQRRRLLDQGIERARWTYDPLVARNANLNLNHLRVRVIDYVPNMYGENPMSRTDSVIGSDRFVVEWDLRTAGGRAPATPPDCPAIGLPENALDAYPEVPKLLVRIPDDIQALKVHDRDAAVAWRRLTRSVITYYLSEGYEVTGFRSGPGASAYVLEAGR